MSGNQTIYNATYVFSAELGSSNEKQEELLENLPDVDCIWSGGCAGIWTGWDDEKQEGAWAHPYTRETLKREDGFWPFWPGLADIN